MVKNLGIVKTCVYIWNYGYGYDRDYGKTCIMFKNVLKGTTIFGTLVMVKHASNICEKTFD